MMQLFESAVQKTKDSIILEELEEILTGTESRSVPDELNEIGEFLADQLSFSDSGNLRASKESVGLQTIISKTMAAGATAEEFCVPAGAMASSQAAQLKETLVDYRTIGYGQINGSFRQGYSTEQLIAEGYTKIAAQRKILEEAIENSSAAPRISYRGVARKALGDAKVGDEILDRGFVSISTDRKTGERFAGVTNPKRHEGGGALVVIESPPDVKALNLSLAIGADPTDLSFEAEYLLQHGTRFRIVSIEPATKKYKVLVYHVVIVP